jgi:hypothetical protein
MDDSSLAAPARRDAVWLIAAVVALLASAAAVINAAWREIDIGLADWNFSAVACIVAATVYLLLTAFAHLGRAHGPSITPRGELWLAVLLLVLAWFILARGAASRLLLAGLAPTVSAWTAAAGVSLLAVLREKLILRPPAATSPPIDRWHLNAWRCLAAAGVLLAVLYLESRPLPETKPWQQPPANQPTARREPRPPGSAL